MIIQTLTKIQKKNGEVVPFEIKKIEGAVQKAINEMEKQIQNRFPNIKYIDLEIN